MSYKGKYYPSYPRKYKVIQQTSFTDHFGRENLWFIVTKMKGYLSRGVKSLLPYRSPLDNRVHRYFPDFYIKVQENTGHIKRYLIEVKPQNKHKTKQKKTKRQTKNYLREVYEHAINQAKWKAADEFCKDRIWEFKVMTENELGIK